MQFTKIDINNWTRKEYFDHYFDNTPCTYSMTVKLDISKLKKDGKKLYPTLLYGVTTILNRHEEFRTALDKNGQVGVFSEMLPCYTIFHKETETFSSIWTEFTADYTEFLQNYQKDIDAYGERKGMFAKSNPPENTFPVSMIPWTSFEGFNLNLRQHRTIAEASAVESPIRQETIGFPAHFFARAHNFKPPGRACQPEADSPMRT